MSFVHVHSKIKEERRDLEPLLDHSKEHSKRRFHIGK
jgi:hypothetical protein